MATLRVFVSSTCFDLGVVRSQLRSFISDIGYEPIMSEYADVLYDPRVHTHTSCITEVASADLLVLIVGSRFGGKAVPEAKKALSLEKIGGLSKASEILNKIEGFSITQLEVLKAVESSIPIYVFVESRVLHDHEVYEKNKSLNISEKIVYPSIQKQDTASFIFEFLNFLRLRNVGNATYSFSRIDEIQEILKRQWGALLQRLLQEQKAKNIEAERIDGLSAQISDLKVALLASIQSDAGKEVATAAVKYRPLISLLTSLGVGDIETQAKNKLPFLEVIYSAGIKEIKSYTESETNGEPFSALVLQESGFIWIKGTFPLEALTLQWDSFTELRHSVIAAVVQASRDSNDAVEIKRHSIPPDEYLKLSRLWIRSSNESTYNFFNTLIQKLGKAGSGQAETILGANIAPTIAANIKPSTGFIVDYGNESVETSKRRRKVRKKTD